MDDIKQLGIFDSVVDKLNLSEKEVLLLKEMYQVSNFKLLIEMLLAAKGSDSKFIFELSLFIEGAFESLDSDKKQLFEEKLLEQKTRMIHEILSEYADQVNPEIKEKIQAIFSE